MIQEHIKKEANLHVCYWANTSTELLLLIFCISQGSVVTHFEVRWEIWHDPCCKFTVDSNRVMSDHRVVRYYGPCTYGVCYVISKGPFIATQLNSTRRRVELSCVGEVCIATPTQLNSTQLTNFALIGCIRCNWFSCIADRRRQLSCVSEGVYSNATQLNSTSSWVVVVVQKSSWVELRRWSDYSDPPTQLSSTRRLVELSCVAINGP